MQDFDQMFAQMRGETIPLRIYGREYRIANDLPADLVLEIARCEGEIPAQLVLRAAERIFGRETLRELAAHSDFTLGKLEKMLTWAFQVCGGGEEEESAGEAGEAKN